MEPILITGLAATSAFGRGAGALLAGALGGRPAIGAVHRFDVSDRRVRFAATAPGNLGLAAELAEIIGTACEHAGLSPHRRANCPLLLAVHGDPAMARSSDVDKPAYSAAGLAEALAVSCGLGRAPWAYTSGCVAATTAVADAAALIRQGDCERVVVAAGYLVEPDRFALFDAGQVLATDGAVRPFSAGRTGTLLGDGVAAVVLESASSARERNARTVGVLAGWGRAGDGYHACEPRPDGAGLGRAIGAAIRRAGIEPEQIGYVNADGAGTPRGDAAECRALHVALGGYATRVPVSSTKSTHGQALEGSGLLELVLTVLVLRVGRLPVNAGYLGHDPDCALRLVLDAPQGTDAEYALTVNTAVGGANTAFVVGVR